MSQVRAEAWKIYQRAPHALELDELEALGLLGLAQAASKWQDYCRRRGYDPQRTEYYAAYCLRRIRGAMLDALRSNDWVTRSARTRAKMLRDAGQDLGLSETELARATGMSVREVRETIAVVASRPVSIDAEPHDVADTADVEGQAAVSSVLAAVVGVLHAQPVEAQAIVALKYYHGLGLPEAAAILGISEERARSLFEETVKAAHSAMVRAVT